MIKWEKVLYQEDSKESYIRGNIGKVWLFAIIYENNQYTLTSSLFFDKKYSSIKTAKRGAERRISDFLKDAELI